MKSQTYSQDLALSSKYFEMTIKFQGSKVFKDMIEVLLGFFYFIE